MSATAEAQAGPASTGSRHSRTIGLKIRRYDPEVDPNANWQTYQVPVEPGDRVLDALHQVKWYQDGSLTFRRSCGHGICGLRRHAHQRGQPAGLQSPRQGRGKQRGR